MKVQEAFQRQAEACVSLGSPFMGQLCKLFATRDWPEGALKSRVFSWPGDITPAGDSVPLRLCGGLHALHLQGHPALEPVYPPKSVSDDALWEAVSKTLITDEAFLNNWINSAPQTNEVRRSVTLIPVGHLLAERFGLPIRTSELGASGGLNLNWDRYALQIGDLTLSPKDPALTLAPDWTGPTPPETRPVVVEKAGVDLNPLDPRAPKDAERLRAYLWPDQADRVALTNAAITAASQTVEKADAVDWLAGHLTSIEGQTHLIYSTVAWQYFPKEAQERGTQMIEAAGAAASPTSPLAWFQMENDGQQPGAALTLRLWPGDLHFELGRADFHGRWVNWTGA